MVGSGCAQQAWGPVHSRLRWKHSSFAQRWQHPSPPCLSVPPGGTTTGMTERWWEPSPKFLTPEPVGHFGFRHSHASGTHTRSTALAAGLKISHCENTHGVDCVEEKSQSCIHYLDQGTEGCWGRSCCVCGLGDLTVSQATGWTGPLAWLGLAYQQRQRSAQGQAQSPKSSFPGKWAEKPETYSLGSGFCYSHSLLWLNSLTISRFGYFPGITTCQILGLLDLPDSFICFSYFSSLCGNGIPVTLLPNLTR